ncbi:unnamed protein product, partial [Sphacelaria rigidula]
VPDGKGGSDGPAGKKSKRKSGSRDLAATAREVDMEAGNAVEIAPYSTAQVANSSGHNRRAKRGDEQSDKWSGGSDATAFMDIGAYDHVRAESCEVIAEPVGLEEYHDMVQGEKSRGPKSVIQALKSVGSRRSSSIANDDGLEGWVEQPLPPSPDRNAPVPKVKVTVVSARDGRRGYGGRGGSDRGHRDKVDEKVDGHGTAMPRRRENREQQRSRSPTNLSREHNVARKRPEQGGGNGHHSGVDSKGLERHRNEKPRGREDGGRQRSRSPRDQSREPQAGRRRPQQGSGNGRGTHRGGREDGGQERSKEPQRRNARSGESEPPADAGRILLSNDRHRVGSNNNHQ